MRSSSVAALLAVVLAPMTLGCGGTTDEAARPPATVTESQPADASREVAPPLAGLTLDGDAIALGDFRGRPVLINVWSSW